MTDLSGQVRKGLALSFAGRGISIAIALGSSMILARLLTPGEIGIYSVGAAAAGFAHALRDFGIGSYLIQERELTPSRIACAFTVTLAFGWTAAALLYLLGSPAAAFYEEPGVADVLAILSLNFVLLPFGSPAMALLSRNLRFSLLYRIGIASSVVQATTSLTLAALGVGFASLAWSSVAGTAVTATLAVWSRRREPFIGPTVKEWRRVFGFSARLSVSHFITQIGMNASDLILGRFLGFTAVGLYSRAEGLIRILNYEVMGAVAQVASPAFAAHRREGSDNKVAYLRTCAMVSGVAWPFFAFSGVMAYPIVRVLFGDQWDGAVPLLRILVLGGIAYQSLPLAGSVLVALGRSDVILKSETVIQTSRVVMILLGALHSLEAVCVAQALTYSLYVGVYRRTMLPLLGATLSEVLAANARSGVVTLCAMAGPLATVLSVGLEPDRPWSPLLVAGATFCVGWLVAIVLTDHPLRREINLAVTNVRGLLAAPRA